MKIIYFDCFAGASGDMILGSLIDSGVPLEFLQNELQKLHLDGFTISAEKKSKHNIIGTHAIVETEEQHHHRTLPKIKEIINSSELNEKVKQNAIAIFTTLAAAEAKIHNTTIDKIHFHEVGALDAIVDIVGASICFEYLQIEKFFVSKIHVGTGFVKCAHGTMPLPAPATAEILKEIPLFNTGIEKELTTPTGAAILKTMASKFGFMPQMKINSIGYGCGTRDLDIPNMLRVYIGESEELTSADYDYDSVVQLETNIDDMNPQIYEYLYEKLFALGVLDITLTQTIMKKQRPAMILSVLVDQSLKDEAVKTIFSETTTIGLRVSQIQRIKLPRFTKSVKTKFGEIAVKYSKLENKILQIKPEYEDCKKAAADYNIPLKDVIDEVKAQASLD